MKTNKDIDVTQSADAPQPDNVKMVKEERIIDVPDDSVEDGRPTEVPKISIEKTVDSVTQKIMRKRKRRDRIITWIFSLMIILLAGFFVVAIIIDSRNEKDRQEESIKSLITEIKVPYTPIATGCTLTSDTVNDVAMEIYSLEGLRASLEMAMPDTTDTSLAMFMRSTDYDTDGKVIGHAYVNGEMMGSEGFTRHGLVTISPEGHVNVNVRWHSEDDVLENRLKEEGIQFFRQFYLLNLGEPSNEFELRGKVERAALVSDKDGGIFYVVTRNRETLADFSQALSEYGFADAIYLPGGNSYTFWRDTTGVAHSNKLVEQKVEKYKDNKLSIPWLVFRSAKAKK